MIISSDVYGLDYRTLKTFDIYTFFSISPEVKHILKDIISYDTLRVAMTLKPFNLILYHKNENLILLRNYRDNKLQFYKEQTLNNKGEINYG